MKKQREEKLLKLWKIRQLQEGYDVSSVRTLEEAENFFNGDPKPEEVQVARVTEESIIEEVSLNDMTKAELLAYAKQSGIKADSQMKKAEIINLIEGK